jgi:hypothetical protein
LRIQPDFPLVILVDEALILVQIVLHVSIGVAFFHVQVFIFLITLPLLLDVLPSQLRLLPFFSHELADTLLIIINLLVTLYIHQ